MIYLFPDFDVYQLALTSGVVPPAVSLAPAVGGVDEDGRPWIESTVKPTRAMSNGLAKLGVGVLKAYPTAGLDLFHWLQLLPIVKEAEPPVLGNQTPVLFELPEPTLLPTIVGEMMRLSNDRQSFRWLKEDETGGVVLLRVVGPPYYTLLRALDREAGKKGAVIRAYVERAPRVWLEIGMTHPLVQKIEPQQGQMVLLRAPRDWIFLDDTPFRDIYEILDFKLPQARLDWVGAELRKRLVVPLRLVEGDRADPELWVLRDRAVDQLDALVRDTKESVLQRLLFAVGQHEGQTTIVLRVRPSKQPPPPLVLEGQAYAKYLKIENLFLPVGTKVHPILRRDALRKLLAEDASLINWLQPHPEKPGAFTPESLPDDVFRPLQDWVEYVLDHDRTALEAWIQEFRFDFEPYICPEEGVERPKPPGAGGRRRGGTPNPIPAADAPAIEVKPAPAPKKRDALIKTDPDEFSELEVLPPSQLQQELTALEQKFLELPGKLDSPDRLKLWPELASRNSALKHTADAALCWMNRIWETPDSDEQAHRDLAWQWVRTEKTLNEPRLGIRDLDRMLKNDSPSTGEIRSLAACLWWASWQQPSPQPLIERLPQVQRYLEENERSMGVRALWLAWLGVCRVANNDTLALARVRDRLFERLIQDGLNPERDVPNFLRSAGHHDSERMRVVRAHMLKLHDSAKKWFHECDREKGETSGPRVSETSGHYADLIFAFGLSRLGEATTSRDLLRQAESTLNSRKRVDDTNDVNDFLFRAYKYRIEQVLAGRPHLGPLPVEWRDQLDRMLPKAQSGSQTRYFIDRMREQSLILEPQEKFDPYRDYTSKQVPELDKRLGTLPDIKDAKLLIQTVQDLLRNGVGKPPSAEETGTILSEALPFSPRAGEAFVQELLSRVKPTLDRWTLGSTSEASPLDKQALLLDRALFVAASYDRQEHVRQLLQDFVLLLDRAQRGKTQSTFVNRMFGQCLRSLRKLGMRDEIGKLIEQMTRLILHGKSVSTLQAAAGKEWPATVMTLLHLAGGWLFFGWADRTGEILDAARDLLYSREEKDGHKDGLFPQQYANLAVTYATVLGQAPVEIALRRIEEMFQKMRRLKDTFTSARYYARLHLNIIEAVVLAMVHEDFAMGPGARRWMDDDEFLVRRRVNQDHLTLRTLAGM